MEQQALAQDYYWNGPTGVFGDGSTFTAGAGTWSAGGNAYWSDDPDNNNPTPVTWPSGPGLAAHFEGPNQGYTSITIDGAVDFEKLYLGNQNGDPNFTNYYILRRAGYAEHESFAGEDVTIIGQGGSSSLFLPTSSAQTTSIFRRKTGPWTPARWRYSATSPIPEQPT